MSTDNIHTLSDEFGERIRHARFTGHVTENGIAYDTDPKGRYYLFRERLNTDEDIRRARAWLRAAHKAERIVVLKLA